MLLQVNSRAGTYNNVPNILAFSNCGFCSLRSYSFDTRCAAGALGPTSHIFPGSIIHPLPLERQLGLIINYSQSNYNRKLRPPKCSSYANIGASRKLSSQPCRWVELPGSCNTVSWTTHKISSTRPKSPVLDVRCISIMLLRDLGFQVDLGT